jgi:hypothetical protein
MASRPALLSERAGGREESLLVAGEIPMWRVAKSLEVLRDQVNAAYPKRSKENDGTIGDAAHQARTSDHNPWVKDGAVGVVTALDITHDPIHGVDAYAIAETLRRNRDRRIKYVISDRRIFSSQLHAWEWHPYTGANPHDRHVHISVLPDKAHYDDRTPWNLRRAVAGEAPARPEKPNFVVQGATVMRSSYDQCLERVLAHEGGIRTTLEIRAARPTSVLRSTTTGNT